MPNLIRNTVELAFYLISNYITPDSISIDATCGNGHDTLSLLDAGVCEVYAFDVQTKALEHTTSLLDINYPSWREKVTLINDNHSFLSKYVTNADIILFNLGYLPTGDKGVTTTKDDTLKALNASLSILNKDGICCIVMYDGHKGGAEEKRALLDFSEKLDSSKFHVAYVSMINQHKNPPEILLITKKY